MSTDDFQARLRNVMIELRKIAGEYHDMKFTATEEAMSWPLSFVVEEDGDIGIWCNKEGCLLDGHSSLVYRDAEEFTVASLLYALIDHIEYNQERVDEHTSDKE